MKKLEPIFFFLFIVIDLSLFAQQKSNDSLALSNQLPSIANNASISLNQTRLDSGFIKQSNTISLPNVINNNIQGLRQLVDSSDLVGKNVTLGVGVTLQVGGSLEFSRTPVLPE